MNLDLQWLLLGLPLAFALGWIASRIDLRQWRREQGASTQAYARGLVLLLNEQQDKAIDAFIEAMQQDPAGTDLPFALGSLFRRRGEYERAVRVHEHLLKRADLPSHLRLRAKEALAQDFVRAGLLDRAEAAYRELEGTSFDAEAAAALLALHERAREWRAAMTDARKLERSGAGSFAARIAHHWCEIASQADARQQADVAADALAQARAAAPQAARPLIEIARRQARLGEHAQAVQTFGELLAVQPQWFDFVAREHAASALECGQQASALGQIEALYQRAPSAELLAAIALLDPLPERRRERLRSHLAAQPGLAAALQLLALGAEGAVALDALDARALAAAVGHAARPLGRYRCAACGFETERHFWQCPGCMSWDSYRSQRQGELG